MIGRNEEFCEMGETARQFRVEQALLAWCYGHNQRDSSDVFHQYTYLFATSTQTVSMFTR